MTSCVAISLVHTTIIVIIEGFPILISEKERGVVVLPGKGSHGRTIGYVKGYSGELLEGKGEDEEK